MPAFALPLAPAVGEGLLWGAGLLGSGLTALGIIENKDAIRDGISDFGSWISNGVGNGIKAWSEAMSPKGPAGPNPNYDVATGKPIAVADVTRVQRPIPVFRQQIQPRPFGATRSVRHDSDGEPIFFPWQTGSPERPIRLNPVTVTESRIMRTDAEGAQPEQPATDSEGGTTAPASPPTPEPEGGDNNRGGKWYKKLWETSGEGSPKWGPKAGRFVRNWGIRVPAYTGAAALPTLSGAGEGSLLSTIIPQIASRTAPQLANMLNWGTLGLGTYAIGRALSEDTPTFSLPVPQFGSRYMATTAPTAPADSTAVGAGNPPVAPSDSTSVAPAQPAAGGATDTGSSTASPAPASPEPERNDSTSNKAPFLQRVRLHLRPFGGYKGGSYMGNAGRLLRDAAYTGFGADVGFNLYESAENPDYQWKWGISRLTTFPERGVLQQLRRIHNSTPEDSIRPAQTQSTQQQGTQVVASPDSVMPMQVDPVAPNDTLNIF